MFPKKELAQLVISICNQLHIDTVVISPGSRNAPLTIGFFNHPTITTLSVVDERCAAFFALGIAQQQEKPVAVVCTSGSALLNYYPAIAEAFYSNIPLIVISADRPSYLIDVGDGQTIRQENIFEKHTLYNANLTIENKEKENHFKVAQAVQTAIYKKGPVHINVPFDEPLYETVKELKKSTVPVVNFSEKKETIDYKKLAAIWNTAEKKIILVGVHYPNDELQKLIEFYAEDPSVLIFTETTSNLHHPNIINAIDQLIFSLTEKHSKELQPTVLVTFGGMVISKKIKAFFRTFKPKHHWNIDEKKATDTFFCLSEFIKAAPVVFFREFSHFVIKKQSNYQYRWLQIRESKRNNHHSFLANAPYSDLKVFERILYTIPSNIQLQISNSSVIRYAQLFTLPKTLQVFCNRGTSGIDGSTSTAIGAAYANKKQTVFITGDLSFFYDSNALWNQNIPENFRIILLNNGGGGIFKIIPGPSTTNAINLFETPHCLTAVHLAKMHHFEYAAVFNLEDLEQELKAFFTPSKRPKILEIFTPSTTNNQVLKQYFNSL